MTFQVNPYTVIENFERKNQFEIFQKFGEPHKYQKFIGEIKGEKVKGFICLADDNIYKLERVKN
ncbi:hypothetical protein SAMN04489761_4318 [Tenacibaculum sp. MAR_2009_124]|uniref:hypothetical protein n=1 Tax=Tenacibaculum sp. MAR_2009_124 TaxID=1250059 RepID=UPI000894609E|nr:hypothetical protein [Tenacibaculum sp. MAR_2009_124]SED11417.1 hypothetical protein SAMN04489761_4318 [Tenacibaculum sp. MAR_2009_124]